MTRQEAIAKLWTEDEELIDEFNNCEDEEECERLLNRIAHKQWEIRILETVFCDKEAKS